jgi:hypothetical protein
MGGGGDLKNICQIIKTRCNDIQRQSNREKMKDKKYLVSYWNVKQKWGREMPIEQRNSKETTEFGWFGLGIS